MSRLDIDWTYLKLANQVLAEYILLPEIYRSITPVKWSIGPVGLSQLSIGNILLSLRRLQTISLSDSEQTELTGICKQIEQIRDRWRANWERKALREFTDRQQLWQVYLDELSTNKKLYSRIYPVQARLRVIIYLLVEEIGTTVINKDVRLERQDNFLRSFSTSGPFVWEADLAGGFPEETCWFLYRAFN
ncbi:MAG TPA: hypothetical protein VKF38_06625 [Anaerolineaceae bacterium]|nr:hypothetical protein [Anaerolineaceae bacterium]